MVEPDKGGAALQLLAAIVADLARGDPAMPERLQSWLRSRAKGAEDDQDMADLNAAAEAVTDI